MAAEIVSIAEANKAVDTIVRVLHGGNENNSLAVQGSVLVVSEVVKGGSLGHGTAVRGNYDVDLVIYSTSLTGQDVLNEGLQPWLSCLQEFLETKLPEKLTETKHTLYALQFKFDGYIDVDLLLSPYWKEPRDYYSFLQSTDAVNRMRFSVGASRWQVKFFKKQPNEVKELIRRAKAWRNKCWRSGDSHGKPKSYLLSVLVLRAYETAWKENFSFSILSFKVTEVMKDIVARHEAADIYWEEYYNKDAYNNLFPHVPRIVDPANPCNNLYKSGIAAPKDGEGKWDRIASTIKSLDLTKSTDQVSPEEHSQLTSKI